MSLFTRSYSPVIRGGEVDCTEDVEKTSPGWAPSLPDRSATRFCQRNRSSDQKLRRCATPTFVLALPASGQHRLPDRPAWRGHWSIDPQHLRRPSLRKLLEGHDACPNGVPFKHHHDHHHTAGLPPGIGIILSLECRRALGGRKRRLEPVTECPSPRSQTAGGIQSGVLQVPSPFERTYRDAADAVPYMLRHAVRQSQLKDDSITTLPGSGMGVIHSLIVPVPTGTSLPQ
ncbi:uncharacterized protein B0T15DRAFT_4531 [Chaetomium strumarium]|uniref:Uncharacterized protein n=1 Tax=Chaetomium strumarium TaxID=1170767 RepID=A0AAJ0M5D6_9PEZI|nr:hypothetical protein B0T15DRAFT_4531 [Chaetomium strumarium]